MAASSTSPSTRILVWDLPTRLFHGLLALSVLGAFGVAVLVDDEGAAFPLHMLLGAVAAFLVALRVVWGFVGPRYARFRSFLFGPRAVSTYLKGVLHREAGERHVGHNPGSSVIILVILALTLGLALTGVSMSRGGESIKEVHEALAFSLVGVVALHVLGVVAHTLRHRENIARSMIDGRKDGDAAQAIPSAHPLVALALVGATALWTGVLVRGYDAGSRSVALPGLGSRIMLGEDERGKEHGGEGGPRERHEHDDD
ncbi:MAG: cytochrome b/b6 domain-containing protein [Byssovorax sp.]